MIGSDQYKENYYGDNGLIENEKSVNLKIQSFIESQNVFVAKVKKITGGLLFIMTNNVFVFDFTDGRKVVVGKDGLLVYSFDDEGAVEFSDDLKESCIFVLKMYCNNK